MKQDLTCELRVIRSSIVQTRAESNRLKFFIEESFDRIEAPGEKEGIRVIEWGIRNTSAELMLIKRSAKTDSDKLFHAKQIYRAVCDKVSVINRELHRGALHNSAGILMFPIEFDALTPQDADTMLMLAMTPPRTEIPTRRATLTPLHEVPSECGTARCRPGMYHLVLTLHKIISKWFIRQSLLTLFVIPLSDGDTKLLSQFVSFLHRIQVRTTKNAFIRLGGHLHKSLPTSLFARSLKELGFTGDILSLIAFFDKGTSAIITYNSFAQYISPFMRKLI